MQVVIYRLIYVKKDMDELLFIYISLYFMIVFNQPDAL